VTVCQICSFLLLYVNYISSKNQVLIADLQGDDGVVNYDVWINGPEQFTHARTIKGIANLGSPSFADFGM